MSRKILLTLLLFSSLGALRAQNLQLHFDPRHTFYGSDVPTASQNYLTATFEMFKPDQWGSTFMFVDFDLNNSKKNIGLVYAEIAREFKIPVHERGMVLQDFVAADEVFLTGSGAELIPVVEIDGQPVADGKVGDNFRELRKQFRERTKYDGIPFK